MWKIILVVSIAAYANTSQSQNLKPPKGYKIEGEIRTLKNGEKIYLFNSSRRKKIDSCLIVDNYFVLQGYVKEPTFTYLYLGKHTKLADILLDNSEIIVTGNTPLYDSIEVSGSSIDSQWREWYTLDQSIVFKLRSLNNRYDSLLIRGNVDAANKLAMSIANERARRNTLLKEYVEKYSDSPAGAVILTFCTTLEILKPNDLLQLFNQLSPDIVDSSMGVEIQEIIRKY